MRKSSSSLEAAQRRLRCKAIFLSVRSDRLFPGICIRRLADEVLAVGGDAAHVELDSPCCQNAFLKDGEQQLLYERRKAMHVIGENIQQDIATGQCFKTIALPIPIMLEARGSGRDVCICLHLGRSTAGQGMIVEAVVPSLKTFCTQLGFQVKDVAWHYREGVAEETRSERSVVGFPNRLLPASWRARALSLAVPVLFSMGGSQIALGLPLLQAPWWLPLSLACHTLARSVWGILLPRLRPSFCTVVFAQHHLLSEQRKGAIDHIQFALGRVQEDRVNRMFATSESLLIAAITPAAGWLIDLFGSVDLVLVIAGLFFVLLLALSLLVSGLICSMHHHRSQVSWHTSGGLVGNSCWACSGKAWLTS